MEDDPYRDLRYAGRAASAPSRVLITMGDVAYLWQLLQDRQPRTAAWLYLWAGRRGAQMCYRQAGFRPAHFQSRRRRSVDQFSATRLVGASYSGDPSRISGQAGTPWLDELATFPGWNEVTAVPREDCSCSQSCPKRLNVTELFQRGRRARRCLCARLVSSTRTAAITILCGSTSPIRRWSRFIEGMGEPAGTV